MGCGNAWTGCSARARSSTRRRCTQTLWMQRTLMQEAAWCWMQGDAPSAADGRGGAADGAAPEAADERLLGARPSGACPSSATAPQQPCRRQGCRFAPRRTPARWVLAKQSSLQGVIVALIGCGPSNTWFLPGRASTAPQRARQQTASLRLGGKRPPDPRRTLAQPSRSSPHTSPQTRAARRRATEALESLRRSLQAQQGGSRRREEGGRSRGVAIRGSGGWTTRSDAR